MEQSVTPATSAEFTCSLLSAALTAAKIDAIIGIAWNGPQFVAYKVEPRFGIRPQQIEAQADALALAAGSESCRVTRTGGHLYLELTKPAADRRPLAASRIEALIPPAATAVCLGLTTGGIPLWWDMADPRTPHVVIGGTTGSGKTVLLKWLIARLAMQNQPDDLQLLLVDPVKAFALSEIAHLPHLVHPLVKDATEAARILAWTLGEIERRSRHGIERPRLLLAIEEVPDLLAVNRGLGDDLGRIAQVGRGLGVNLIVTAQQPGAASLGPALANFPVRIIGRIASSTLAYGAAGRGRTAVDALIGNGDMIYLDAGAAIRFQAPLPDGRTWSRLPRAAQIATLPDLPAASQIADRNRDPRGGRGARPLAGDDYAAIETAVRAGASPDDLRARFRIGYGRAARMCTEIRSLNP